MSKTNMSSVTPLCWMVAHKCDTKG